MTLSANGQRISNVGSVELNSGGAANPSVETGTDDPSSLGKAAAEGSIYLRHVGTAGEVYLKTGVADTSWGKLVVGTASVSLDQAYDSGSTITADSGPVQVNNNAVDTTACLKLQRIPGGAAASPVLDIDAGVNATGVAVDVLIGNVAAEGLRVVNSLSSDGTVVYFNSAGLGASGKVLRIGTTGATDPAGIGLSIEMDGALGKAIVANSDVDITGILKVVGGQHTAVVALADGASIATNASLGNIFSVTIAGNRTLANPTNLDDGTYIWVITQDGAGSRTLAYDTLFKFPSGIAPVLSTAPGSVDVLTAIYDGTNLLTTFQADFS